MFIHPQPARDCYPSYCRICRLVHYRCASTITKSVMAAPNPSSPAKPDKHKARRKPARPQVDSSSSTLQSQNSPQTGTTENIWYNKWAGGEDVVQRVASSRCSIARDSGYTRADSTHGTVFCLFFARGQCPRGVECEYLHRLPRLYDQSPSNTDCFGRDKYSGYRDDMGGVGSFMLQNRTIYCGRIYASDYVEEVVARHFQEWGEIERTRVLSGRSVAFVTYVNEANAQVRSTPFNRKSFF